MFTAFDIQSGWIESNENDLRLDFWTCMKYTVGLINQLEGGKVKFAQTWMYEMASCGVLVRVASIWRDNEKGRI